MGLSQNPNIFANNPLDRASYRRSDEAWIGEQMRAETSLFVPFHKLAPFVFPEENPGQGKDVGWLPMALLAELAGREVLSVFLGLNKRGKALFAVDVSHLTNPDTHPALAGIGAFEDLRRLAEKGEITSTELAILAQGKSMIDWHRRHRFCSACGQPSDMMDAGYRRRCPACKAEHFPRTDPVVIMLATHNDRCFLGRQTTFPKGMYSALAGFLEPGESIEEAVARELHEEAGLSVSDVTYHSTQPWPYPSSLMIGCLATADTDAYEIDGIELSEGRWFSREEIRATLQGKGDGSFWLPPAYAIAHQLMRSFAGL